MVQLLNNKNIISLGKLSPTRDFNFIDDTVDGFIAALNATNDIGEIVNIGSSYEISIEDTAYLIADIMEKSIVIESDETRIRPDSSEVERLLCENSKAKKLYDWSPQFSGKDGLRSGLSLTVDWLKNPSNLALYKSYAYNI
jgi:dTDP-glucose 4,6-dehydratase